MEITKMVIEFDYNLETLRELKTGFSAIDKTNIAEIERAKKEIVKINRAIETKGKTYRDESNAFNKRVLTKEKEYVAILEPLETEFKQIIEDDKQNKIMEARKSLLQGKKDQLSLLTQVLIPSDEEILAMNDESWVLFYTSKFEENKVNLARIESDKIKVIEDEKREKENKELRKQREEADKKTSEANKIADEAKIAREKVEKELKDKEDKEKADIQAKIEAEKLEKEEQIKLEKETDYRDWLKKNGYTKETKDDFVIDKVGDKIRLLKIVGIYTV